MKKFCIVQDITSNPDDMMYLAWNKANDGYFWTSKQTFDSLKHNDVEPHKFTFDTIMEAAKCAESIGFKFEGNIICIDVPECMYRAYYISMNDTRIKTENSLCCSRSYQKTVEEGRRKFRKLFPKATSSMGVLESYIDRKSGETYILDIDCIPLVV